MPRRPRRDKPGRLHHVLSRGQDRQTIFHRDADYHFFISLLALAVARGRVCLHAYCLMPNHFHLLIESVDGDLSATMQWILGRYGGYFNAVHGHVGHVFGGRFRSIPVMSRTYLLTLIRYIDRNPIKAKKKRDPLEMPWCSAFHHARPQPRPHWLSEDVIDRFLSPRLARGEDREAAYRSLFRIAVPDPVGDEIVESRVESGFWVDDELDLLVRMGPESLGAWLSRRTSSTASHSVLLIVCDAGSVLQAITEGREAHGTTSMILCGTRRRDVFALIEAGLLRDLAGRTLESAASLTHVSVSCVQQRSALHRRALLEEELYRLLAGRVVHRTLALAYPSELRHAVFGEENLVQGA